jgi:hypothetical protein
MLVPVQAKRLLTLQLSPSAITNGVAKGEAMLVTQAKGKSAIKTAIEALTLKGAT